MRRKERVALRTLKSRQKPRGPHQIYEATTSEALGELSITLA